MKYLFTSLVTLVAILVTYAAGQYHQVVLLDGTAQSVLTTNSGRVFTNLAGTNNLLESSANTTTNGTQSNLVMRPFLSASATVGFSLSAQAGAAATPVLSVSFQKSYNRTNWESVPVVLSVTVQGQTRTEGHTNFSIGDFGYVRVLEITNIGSGNVSNIFAAWYTKE